MDELRCRFLACAAPLAMAAVLPLAAHGEENFQINTISALTTDRARPNDMTGTGTSDGKFSEIQFEHFGVTKWGYFYFDLETYHGHGVGSLPVLGNNGSAHEMLALAVPSISLSKLTGHSFTLGPISDVSLIAVARLASYYRYQSNGVGVSFHFYVPGFDWFESGLVTQNSTSNVNPVTFDTNTGKNYTLDKNKWLWRTYLITKPIDLGQQRFHYVFFSFINSSGDGDKNRHGTEVFMRHDLTWEIGGNSDYQIGLRFEHTQHRNSPLINFGRNRHSSNVPYLVFKGSL